ncbi:MAG: dihydroneopterin triphosphate diphosphatase [Burkholderiales bacterium]|tara:strand:- start:23647 stop:24120 length:474 start_codon:yes stop_codon:yes gene_type:complete
MMPDEGRCQSYKNPISVLVVVYTLDLEILLLERADRKGFWQSVTGSCESGEKTYETAVRELKEETGINANDHHLINWNMSNEFEIFKHWRGRYAPGVTHNVEHAFGLLVPGRVPIKISPREHLQFDWVRIEEAMDRVFSWTNVDALRFLLKNHASSR